MVRNELAAVLQLLCCVWYDSLNFTCSLDIIFQRDFVQSVEDYHEDMGDECSSAKKNCPNFFVNIAYEDLAAVIT